MAIGGGNIRTGETRRIDARIVELTGKQRPRVLFVPTASGDSREYTEAFLELYASELGCSVDVLMLYRSRPAPSRMASMVAEADAIYVGGGNTLRMMKLWRRLGFDRLLRSAHERRAVLAGTSAGGICWFRDGHSDSRAYSAKAEPWEYIKVRGLGFVNATFCPHYHAEGREQSVERTVARHGGVVVACDNCTAIEIVNGQWRVFRSRRMGKAYKIFRKHREAAAERLPADHEFRPLSILIRKARMLDGSGGRSA